MSKELTPRQQEIVELAGQGRTVEQIAKRLGIGPTAVYGHATRIRKKGTRIELTTAAAASNGDGDGKRAESTEEITAEVESAINAIDAAIDVNETEKVKREEEILGLESDLEKARADMDATERRTARLHRSKEALTV